MAMIRPQEINPVNFDAANRLRMAGQQMITGGISGVQDALKDYRGAIVDRNTANAVGLLTGAKDMADYQQRQGQLQSLLQQAGGDINAADVNKAAATMPDTLMSRQNTQNQLKTYDISQHDAPINNAIMARYMAGDIAGANELAATLQGDASKAFTFGANRQDAANAERDRQAQLAISREGLALRKAAAAKAGAGNKQLLSLYQKLLQPGTDASLESSAAATKDAETQAEDRLKNSSLNNPKADVQNTVRTLNQDSTPWYSTPLTVGKGLATSLTPYGVKGAYNFFVNGENPYSRVAPGNTGNKVVELANKIPGYDSLNNEQKSTLLQRMGGEYDRNDSFFGKGNPEEAASKLGKADIDEIRQGNKASSSAKLAGIKNKQRIREQNLQTLLPLMLSNPTLAAQYQSLLDEE